MAKAMNHKRRRLRIAWWNTSLNPPVRKKKITIHTTSDEVATTLLWLMNKYDIIFLRRPLFKRIWNLAALICIGWRQVGESNFVIKAGEGSPLFGNAEMTKIENWRLRPAMGDAGLS